MAKISFIIPVYNTAKYLDDCMTSVMGQTYEDIEIILIDDGSTDGISPQMCDDYASFDKRIRVIHKDNGGLMSAWIAGAKAATSDYLTFVDSDDLVSPQYLAVLLQSLTEANAETLTFIWMVLRFLNLLLWIFQNGCHVFLMRLMKAQSFIMIGLKGKYC